MFYSHCCKGGKLHLLVYKLCQALLDRLVRFGGGSEWTEFMWLISSYNNMFAFSFLWVKVDDSINTGRVPYVQCQVHVLNFNRLVTFVVIF